LFADQPHPADALAQPHPADALAQPHPADATGRAADSQTWTLHMFEGAPAREQFSLQTRHGRRAILTPDLASTIWSAGGSLDTAAGKQLVIPPTNDQFESRVKASFTDFTKLSDDAYIVNSDTLITLLVRSILVRRLSEPPISATLDTTSQPPSVTRMYRHYKTSIVLNQKLPARYFEQSDYNIFVWCDNAITNCEVEHMLLVSLGSRSAEYYGPAPDQLEYYKDILSEQITYALNDAYTALSKPVEIPQDLGQ
jgi:hypothetical protein